MEASEQTSLGVYYRFHARIYDLTRWAFLFGRSRLVRSMAQFGVPRRILEIGCGTGRNLDQMAREFPKAEITGIDLSEHMLNQARRKLSVHGKRIHLINGAYQTPLSPEAPFDAVFVSYCLSMINPGMEQVLQNCADDLSPSGFLAVLDFHSSSSMWFKRWMRINHVKMEEQISHSLALLSYVPEQIRVTKAYGGLWTYLEYIGRKPTTLKDNCGMTTSQPPGQV